jgi:hypothetical protein
MVDRGRSRRVKADVAACNGGQPGPVACGRIPVAVSSAVAMVASGAVAVLSSGAVRSKGTGR